MLAMFHGKVASDDAFNVVRARYGDTTSSAAQLSALAALGLRARFTQRGTWQTLERELTAGRPFAAGVVHNGPISRPSGSGHWQVGTGIDATSITVHDPMGEPDLLGGGFVHGRSGVYVRCTRQNWGRRWMLEGAGSGWALFVTP
jgi:hypothetical protein